MYAYIKAISYHLPEKVFSNEDFFRKFPEANSNKENLLKIGVKNRHVISENETASDIGIKSALALFKEHNVVPDEIDFLIFCAQEFDYYTPATANVIQEKLKLPKNCGALDFNLGCSGYVYGLSLAKGLVESLGMKNVLLITSSSLTKKFHEKDRSSQFLFGDAAASTLISRRETKGIGQFIFGTDGTGANKIIVKDGGARNKIVPNSYNDNIDEYGNITNDASFFMNGTSVFSFGLKTVPKLVEDTLNKECLTKDEIDLYIFHQANKYLIDTIASKLGLSKDKVFYYLEDVGNTVSASIPIALAEALKTGNAKSGNRVLLVGFGVGFSWASTIITL